MCLRLRIAKLLAPEAFKERDATAAAADYYKHLYVKWSGLASRREDALYKIIDRATPGANSTVKAMVKIAKDGLYGETK